jgi:hypothetical protein
VHQLGRATTNTGYYSYWFNLKNKVNKESTNAFWNSCKFTEQRNAMRYRTGTLYNQKHAFHFNHSPNTTCPLCPSLDSALHMLSGCQHTMIKNVITERHNIASRIIIQALSKGALGANLTYTDVSSTDRLTDSGIDTSYVANRILPSWLLPHLSETEIRRSSRPDAIFILPTTTGSARFTDSNSVLNQFAIGYFNPRHWEVHILEFKYCEDTRPQIQCEKAEAQHATLIHRLQSQKYHKLKLHTILNVVMGTIYTEYTDQPLQDLGLDFHQTAKVTTRLNQHAVQFASKLIQTRRAMQYNKTYATTTVGLGVDMDASARNPPDPH